MHECPRSAQRSGRNLPASLLLLFLPGGLLAQQTPSAPAEQEEETKKAPEQRIFDFGQPTTLALAGEGTYSKISGSRTTTTLSISIQYLYEVHLYLDDAGARQALEPFRGKPLASLLKKPKIHRAIVEADFPKAVVLKGYSSLPVNELRHYFAEDLGTIAGASEFVGFLQDDFDEGDEIVLRITGGESVRATVEGKDFPEIRSRALARALLGLWLGKDKLSADEKGLLSRATAWLR